MAEEVKKTEADPVKPAPEQTEDKTVGEIIKDAAPEGADSKKPEPETVPLSSLLEFKNENKELKKAIKDLEARVKSGDASPEDVTDDLEALATEFNIEPKFVSKLAKIFEARATKKVGDSMKPILEQNEKLSKKEKEELIDKAFKKHYSEALERMPEFGEIADADVIKALSLLPQNANKTFAQLIEDTYGKAIKGKRTIDGTKPAGGKDPEPIDYDRARKDTAYFQEIMADPDRKKEYNKRLTESNRRRS